LPILEAVNMYYIVTSYVFEQFCVFLN